MILKIERGEKVEKVIERLFEVFPNWKFKEHKRTKEKLIVANNLRGKNKRNHYKWERTNTMPKPAKTN